MTTLEFMASCRICLYERKHFNDDMVYEIGAYVGSFIQPEVSRELKNLRQECYSQNTDAICEQNHSSTSGEKDKKINSKSIKNICEEIIKITRMHTSFAGILASS